MKYNATTNKGKQVASPLALGSSNPAVLTLHWHGQKFEVRSVSPGHGVLACHARHLFGEQARPGIANLLGNHLPLRCFRPSSIKRADVVDGKPSTQYTRVRATNLTDSFCDDVIVVRVDGEMDRATASSFSEHVGPRSSLGRRRFLVDLGGRSIEDGTEGA